MVDLADEIFESIDTIVQARIANLKYDKTLECVVTDTSKSASGDYVVESQASSFTVQGEANKYSQGDLVSVLIPENDYNNTRIILQKIRKEDTASKVAKQIYPFSDIVYNKNQNYVNLKTEFPIMANSDTETLEVPVLEINSPISGYDVLGLRFTIDSSIKKAMSSGDYGIYITFKGYNKSSISTTQEEAMTRQNEYGLSREFGMVASADMILSDIYDTSGQCNQEKVFDISNYVITELKLYVWQNKNFKDSNGNAIIPKSIIFSNIELYFGFNKSSFNTNKQKLLLDTYDGLLYSQIYQDKNLYIKFFKYTTQDNLVESSYLDLGSVGTWQKSNSIIIQSQEEDYTTAIKILINNNSEKETCALTFATITSNSLSFVNTAYIKDTSFVNYSNDNNARIERNFNKIIEALKKIDSSIIINLE